MRTKQKKDDEHDLCRREAGPLVHENTESDFHSEYSLDVPSIGVGRLRTSGAWVLMMLMAEGKGQREQILVEVMKRLNITPERLRKVMDDKGCPHCGISLLLHEDREGDEKGKCF